MSRDACLSLSDFLCLVWESLGPPDLCKWYYLTLFCGREVLHRTYVLHPLYPLICHWTLRSLSYLGCWKQCCYGHNDARLFSNYSFVWVHPQEWDCWLLGFKFLNWKLCRAQSHVFFKLFFPFIVKTFCIETSIFRGKLHLEISGGMVWHPKTSIAFSQGKFRKRCSWPASSA